MTQLKLKAKSDSPAVDQQVQEIELVWQNKDNWYGKPTSNQNCPLLTYPKFAWKVI